MKMGNMISARTCKKCLLRTRTVSGARWCTGDMMMSYPDVEPPFKELTV